MTNYHGELMNLPVVELIKRNDTKNDYLRGHRDARHAAAEQVGIAADRRIAELEAQVAAAEGLAAALREMTARALSLQGMLSSGDTYDFNNDSDQEEAKILAFEIGVADAALAAWDAAKGGK